MIKQVPSHRLCSLLLESAGKAQTHLAGPGSPPEGLRVFWLQKETDPTQERALSPGRTPPGLSPPGHGEMGGKPEAP